MENQNKIKLKRITLGGFKSFDSSGHTINIDDVTVLIGANGAGKSNLISFFRMTTHIMKKALQQFIGEQGLASSLLNYGTKVTPKLSAKIEFENDQYFYDYNFSLAHAAHDSLIFTEETISCSSKKDTENVRIPVQSDLKESGLNPDIESQHARHIRLIYNLLVNCRIYQFHDTSSTSKMRNGGYINQGEYLYSDGGNLAAFLYNLKLSKTGKPYYDKIVRHIKQVFPQFGDFVLKPTPRNENFILLDWQEQSQNEYVFGPHQISDGTIRFMALATLLLQPPDNLPAVIILDEPELGLHPSAIVELAGMIKIAGKHTQVILATQNPALLDEFLPEQITVIERNPSSQSSIFKKFDFEELKEWLTDFSLSEIWDKNILGGKP